MLVVCEVPKLIVEFVLITVMWYHHVDALPLGDIWPTSAMC